MGGNHRESALGPLTLLVVLAVIAGSVYIVLNLGKASPTGGTDEGGERTLQQYVRDLASPDADVRERARQSLYARPLDALLPFLENANPQIRRGLLEVMTLAAAPGDAKRPVYERVRRMHREDPDIAVRGQALRTMSLLTSDEKERREVHRYYIEALEDDSARIQAAAMPAVIYVLRRWRSPRDSVAERQSSFTAEECKQLLGRIILLARQGQPEVRVAAREQLRTLDPRKLAFLEPGETSAAIQAINDALGVDEGG